MSIQLSFHGGVGTVTGSCHLLRAGGLSILVDCGLFQGEPEWEDRNYEDFGFDPSTIDYLLITHGHLDHIGRIPVLVKKGFRGKIICTSATYDIAKIILMDSAKIQEEDYERWSRIKGRKGLPVRDPLYTTLDVLDTLRLFSSFAHYKKPVRLNGRVKATFRDAGHIFGSAFIEIDIQGWGRMVFSGDLGNRGKPVIRDPSFAETADLAVVEGTYGNRHHKSIDDSIEELRNAIEVTCQRGGNVLIPSFAIERAQELLYMLREFHEQKELPAVNVFLDSPMAIKMTDVMRRNPEFYDNETEKLVQRLGDPFDFPGLQLTRTPDESRKINFIRSNAIIIAGSGMCTGGRIKHHLKQNIWRKESSVIFVGYQAKGTLGRMLVDRKKRVKIFGDSFRVKSPIYTIGGFSSHADQGIIIDWLQHMKNLKQIFLVHGEESGLLPLRDELTKQKVGKKIHVPHIHELFSIK